MTISNPHHARHIRAAKDDIVQNYGNLNLSKRYDESYSAIFNIILFTSIFLLAALISTAGESTTVDTGSGAGTYTLIFFPPFSCLAQCSSARWILVAIPSSIA